MFKAPGLLGANQRRSMVSLNASGAGAVGERGSRGNGAQLGRTGGDEA
jgi:hypothetical protein